MLFKLALAVVFVGLCEGLPLLNISVAKSWPNKTSDYSFGDIRAVVDVTSNSTSAIAQIFWRRRDNHPTVKAVLVADSTGKKMKVIGAVVQSECGVVTFQTKNGPGRYYVYYLPYTQTQGGARLHFHWYNCTNHTDACVLGGSVDKATDACATVLESAAAVSGLECREKFHCFSPMELMALPSEIHALEAAAGVAKQSPFFMAFLDTANWGRQLRTFGVADKPPALWAAKISATERNVMEMSARAGQFFVFQIGLYALQRSVPGGHVTGVDVAFSPLAPSPSRDSTLPSSTSIPSTAFRCFNLQGVGIDGAPFTKEYILRAGSTGVLWVGVDIPVTTPSGLYQTAITVSALTPSPSTVAMTLKLNIATPAVAGHGDADIDGLSRLRWLDSTAGMEDLVTKPYIPVAVTGLEDAGEGLAPREQQNEGERGVAGNGPHQAGVVANAAGIVITCLKKRVEIGPNGLPTQVTVTTPTHRRGRSSTFNTSLLARPVLLELYDSDGIITPLVPSAPGVVWSATKSDASWNVTLTSTAGVEVEVQGTLEYTGYMTFAAVLRVSSDANTHAVELNDVRLVVAYRSSNANSSSAATEAMIGLGARGSSPADLQWRWEKSQGDNMVSGILLGISETRDP
jgi:hypothetical protein